MDFAVTFIKEDSIHNYYLPIIKKALYEIHRFGR